MSSITPELIRSCKRCLHELAPGALECGLCHALVHADELQRLAAEAKALESKGELRQAREQWLTALLLLPPVSKQADWIRDHMHALERTADAAQLPDLAHKSVESKNGSIADAVIKGATLFGVFLVTLTAFIVFYWGAFGSVFGIGFAVLILIHEMGHFIDIKRRGLPADMPVFLPGFGAYVRWRALGVSLETRAAVSLAGPLAGAIAAVACGLIWWRTGDSVWAALARSSAWLNVLNLTPVWMLDGGQAVAAMSRAERQVLLAASVVLGITLGQNLLLLVAAGAAWQVFAGDFPPHPSRVTTAYFLAVLTILGLVMWLMPGQGFGSP